MAATVTMTPETDTTTFLHQRTIRINNRGGLLRGCRDLSKKAVSVRLVGDALQQFLVTPDDGRTVLLRWAGSPMPSEMKSPLNEPL
jgi:hypothetical protein